MESCSCEGGWGVQKRGLLFLIAANEQPVSH